MWDAEHQLRIHRKHPCKGLLGHLKSVDSGFPDEDPDSHLSEADGAGQAAVPRLHRHQGLGPHSSRSTVAAAQLQGQKG